MIAYYNEIDPYAAQWLRNLIAAGHIAPGVVDTRSIEDVRPSDLAGFTQCHFFAGLGAWSLALRRAGWPDDRRVWTASCPCQPFSSAGKGGGMGDERHLWPALFHLIEQRQPAICIGEQVASKDAEPWLDLVQTDLEIMGYTFGCVPFPAASVGAPHIRDRLYWVAHTDGRHASAEREQRGGEQRLQPQGGGVVGLAHSSSAGLERGDQGAVGHERATVERGGGAGGLEHAAGQRRNGRVDGAQESGRDVCEPVGRSASRPTRGFWADADWLPCRDGKFRPVEPGAFPLAHGAPARVGRLRAYGNAIVAPQAQVWIETVMDCIPLDPAWAETAVAEL